MRFGTANARQASDHGTAAWLRVLVVALLIALVVPALAMADDGTAVMDPPVQTDPAAQTPSADPATETPAAEQPVDPAPATEPAPPVDPAAQTDPAAPPASDPVPAPTPPVVVVPVVDIPIELPGLPEINLPTLPPAAGEAPVPEPGAAPTLPELTPGAGTVPVVELPPLVVTPAEPPAIHLAAEQPPAAPPTPPTPGVADALGIPGGPPAITIGPPQDPGLAAFLSGAREPNVPADAATGLLTPREIFAPGMHQIPLTAAAAQAASATHAALDLAAADPTFTVAPQMVVPVGPAPAGSSLLAVLAGYVLPGSSGPPASTLVMLIVIGLILGVGYAARPGLTEAVASATLLGASSGHGMAVRRPG